jgi:glycosyltransferase involved in cell wall biosynthesis
VATEEGARPVTAALAARTHRLAPIDGPLVSIGLPVYNGTKHLPRAVESLLGQSYRNLELIISDNASTDDTYELCQRYARADSRVRVFRQGSNIGVPRNWNFVVHQARGEYFKWASANDHCAPTMIEKCLPPLLADRGVVLSFPRTQLFESETVPGSVAPGDFAVGLPTPSGRFEVVLNRLEMNNAQCGIIRLAALRRTRLDRMYMDGDLVLMAELALLGKFNLVDEVLFYRRVSPDSALFRLPVAERQAVFAPGQALGLVPSRWRRLADYLGSVAIASISLTEKGRCLRTLARHTWYSRRVLFRDLKASLAALQS